MGSACLDEFKVTAAGVVGVGGNESEESVCEARL